MNFHRLYALKGFLGGDNNENDGSDGGIKLPDNAGIYYIGTAESTMSMDVLRFESSVVGEVTET